MIVLAQFVLDDQSENGLSNTKTRLRQPIPPGKSKMRWLGAVTWQSAARVR